LETIHRDYSPKGVQFLYVYKSLAHPGNDGFVQPLTLEERLMHVKEADRQLDTDWTWLADAPDNQVKDAFGNRNNSEFIIDPEGKIIRGRVWSSAEDLRSDLAELVGEVDPPTTIADLDRKPEKTPGNSEIARNVVPRVATPRGAQAMKVQASESAEPYYIKLRADAESSVIRNGEGVIKLGFHLDPIHQVHWNNLAEPLKYTFTSDNGEITPAAAMAEKVEEEADYDPREFLVEIVGADPSKPLTLTVSYFPCHDVDEWCKMVQQEFQVEFMVDQHAGKPRGGGGPGGKGRPTGKGKAAMRPGGGGPDPKMLIERMDKDGDGKIAKSEAAGKMVERFDQMDADKDGFVTTKEIEAAFSRGR
jgi:hypothetical protein